MEMKPGQEGEEEEDSKVVSFEVLTATLLKIQDVWAVTPCRL
jgi:hypothetical protein